MNKIDQIAKALFENHYKKHSYAAYNSGMLLFGTDQPTWEMATAPDTIPEIAEQWREQARVAIEAIEGK